MKLYEDCFARIEVRCGVLKDTLCKKGKCPFYKSKQQHEMDMQKYPFVDYKDRIKKQQKESECNG